MVRSSNRLTATGVAKIRKKGRYADGGGLYLRVSPSLSKAWVFRWVRGGIENEMGLGRYPDVSLADARQAAFLARRHLAAGRNPRSERDNARAGTKPFGEAADEYLESMRWQWTSEKTVYQWIRDLTDLSVPIRRKPVSEIDTNDVLRLLKPIWTEKPETAAKARMRLEAVLDYAKAKGWREGENPARWRGHLANILPARQPHSRGHHAAMHYVDVPAFVARLSQSEALAARALELLVLTACRSSEVLDAVWSEIHLSDSLWIIPAERTKARRIHKVPLTSRMIEILMPLYETRHSSYVFPGRAPSKPLTSMTVRILMKRMKVTNATTHGFRSSFRDWAGDCTSFPREIAEAALAHKVGDSTELAYRRGDALEKRRKLMEAWGEYCHRSNHDKVVQFVR